MTFNSNTASRQATLRALDQFNPEGDPLKGATAFQVFQVDKVNVFSVVVRHLNDFAVFGLAKDAADFDRDSEHLFTITLAGRRAINGHRN